MRTRRARPCHIAIDINATRFDINRNRIDRNRYAVAVRIDIGSAQYDINRQAQLPGIGTMARVIDVAADEIRGFDPMKDKARRSAVGVRR
jgi:hypothetical protein